MFTLLYGFYEYVFRKDEYHVLILGVDKAGKTNVLERLKTLFTNLLGLDPGKILPTVGLNVGKMLAFGEHVIFWDLGGQAGLRSIWEKYYDESHALIYVVDATNTARFDESKAALDRALGHTDLFGAPLLILANKQDLPDASSAQEIADHFGIGKMDSRPVKVLPACAYTGEGLKDAMQWLIEVMRKNPRTTRIRMKNSK